MTVLNEVQQAIRHRIQRWRRAVAAAGGRLRRGVHDAGMATAEYAVATLAACGFAALLFTILRSGEMKSLLMGIIRRALSV